MLKITDEGISKEIHSKGQGKERRTINIRSSRMQYKNNPKQNKGLKTINKSVIVIKDKEKYIIWRVSMMDIGCTESVELEDDLIGKKTVGDTATRKA